MAVAAATAAGAAAAATAAGAGAADAWRVNQTLRSMDGWMDTCWSTLTSLIIAWNCNNMFPDLTDHKQSCAPLSRATVTWVTSDSVSGELSHDCMHVDY